MLLLQWPTVTANAIPFFAAILLVHSISLVLIIDFRSDSKTAAMQLGSVPILSQSPSQIAVVYCTMNEP